MAAYSLLVISIGISKPWTLRRARHYGQHAYPLQHTAIPLPMRSTINNLSLFKQALVSLERWLRCSSLKSINPPMARAYLYFLSIIS